MKKFTRSLLSIIFLGLSGVLQAQTFHPDYLDGHLYLKVEDTSSVDLDPYNNSIPALNAIMTTFGVDSLYQAFKTVDPLVDKIYRLEFSSILGADNLSAQLAALSFVDYAEKVPLIQTNGTNYVPNDLQTQQWGLVTINAASAWDVAIGNSQVVVAVVDNAIFIDHEDLQNVIWTNTGEIPNNSFDDDLNGFTDDVNGYDVADFDPNTNPPSGTPPGGQWSHGTHCSGTVGSETDNGVGIASIGFGVSIMPVKASLDVTGGGTLERAYEGVDYAISAGADIVSMSWGSKGNAVTGQTIMQLAASRGIVLIAAAGNNDETAVYYPANYPGVMAVGATDNLDRKSSFSNYGSWIDVMAPGTGIYSCYGDAVNSYGNLSGTSMACPLVAGLAGLILSADPSLTAAQVKDAIVNNCDNIDLQNPTYIGQMGAGRINAQKTMQSLVVAIQEGIAPAGFQVYPNPFTTTIEAEIGNEGSGPINVEILGMDGRLVHRIESPGSDSQNFLRMDLSHLEAGVYFVRIRKNGSSGVRKIIKR